MSLFTTQDYAPVVLSAGNPRLGRGRRRNHIQAEWKNIHWYCTWVIENGSLDLHLETGKKHLNGPCAFIIPPGLNHRIDLPMGTSYSLVEWGVTNAIKERRGRGPACRYAERSPQPNPVATWGVDLPIVLPHSCYDLCSKMAAWVCSQWWRNPFAHAAANGCLAQWIGELLNEINETSQSFTFIGKYDPEVEPILRIAQNHLDKSFTIERWALLAGMTRQQLTLTLRKHTGETASSHLNRMRLAIAKTSLMSGLSIHKTSLRCGFTTADSFSRWFRKIYHKSPSQWRGEME